MVINVQIFYRNHTVHSKNNRTQVKDSTELNYYPNQQIFMLHIRLIPTNLTPKNIWSISADRPNIWIFRFFSKFFFSKFLRYSLFFGKNFLGEKFQIPRTYQKIMKNFLENNITSKNCLIKNFGCTHNRHKKIQFFRFFGFCTGKIGYFEIGENTL